MFRSTEVNPTFRRLPGVKNINRWRDESPEDFCFSLKAPHRVAHFAMLRDYSDTMNKFREVVKGLGTRLGPVLFQLPETFEADAVQVSEFLQSIPEGMRRAFEFSQKSWFTERV